MKKINLLYFVFLIFLIPFVSGADCGGSTQCSCGDTLVEDHVMSYDLICADGNGIMIGNADLTLDCNGHTIDGVDRDVGFNSGVQISQGNALIKNCDIKEFNYGVYSSSTGGNLIFNNTIQNNSRGVSFNTFAFYNIIDQNIIRDNTYGVILSMADFFSLSNNKFYDNIEAIALYDANVGDIIGNDIYNNSLGITLISAGSNVSENNIHNNGLGIELYRFSSQGNVFSKNDFYSNLNHIGFESLPIPMNHWNNSEYGNYWDDFENNSGYPNNYFVTENNTDYKPNEYFIENENPVLLIHGIYSNDAMWEVSGFDYALEYNGFDVYKVGEVLGQEGLIPNSGNIKSLSYQLRDAINIIKSQTGAQKVDIVAHSMGGLVSSWYIKSNYYQNDIDNIVTIDSPFYGTPLASHPLAPLFDDWEPESIAQYQLQEIGTSNFITYELEPNGLNQIFDNKNVEHTAIVGTYNDFFLLSGFFLASGYVDDFFNIIALERPFIFEDSDTIVPVNSQTLPSSTCYKKSLAHNDVIANEILSVYSSYRDPDVIAGVMEVLRFGNTNRLDDCGQIDPREIPLFSPSSVNEVLDSFTLSDEEYVTTQPFIQGSIFGGFFFENSVEARINETIQVNAEAYSPSGVKYLPSQVGDNYVNFNIETNETGNWTFNVSLVNTSMNVNATFFANSLSDIGFNILETDSFFLKNSNVLRKVAVFNGSENLTGGNLTDKITKPNGNTVEIILYDDGLNNDELANDGIYSGLFSDTSLLGDYQEVYVLNLDYEYSLSGNGFLIEKRTSGGSPIFIKEVG